MSNWAIIIGVNQYWKPAFCLKGAVGDAVRMAEWLLNSPECGVPPGNMYLLTNPPPADAPAGVNLRDATADNLKKVLNDLNQRSGGQGERLFFYFSGHGISNYESFRNEQAVVMTDFTEDLTDKAIKLDPIKEFFKATGFREQFFFIDACRNAADFKFDFETGSTTKKTKLDASKATKIDQFILYATSPGNMSKEGLPTADSEPGEEQGAFTAALLDGLGGDGTAKEYDSENGDYMVRAEALMDYVIRKITERSIFVSKTKDPTKPVLIQLPRKDGERSNNNPVLARVPASQAKPETLELFVKPNSVWPQAEVSVRGEDFNDTTIKPVPGEPIVLSPLPPMKYTVRAIAPDHAASKRSFDLYEPTGVTLTLKPDKVTITPGSPQGESAMKSAAPPVELEAISKATISEDVERIEETDAVELSVRAESEPGRLAVETSDPLSSLELADSTGHLLRAAQGRFDLEGMSPGFYRVRLLTPEGQTVEEVVELSPGEAETVRLSAPDPPQTRLFKDIVASANFLVQEDKTLEVSKTVGPIASAQLSTILALAANASNRGEKWGTRLKSLGLTPFKEATAADSACGLQVISGVEFTSAQETSGFLAEARLRLWPFGEAVPESADSPAALSSVVGVAQYAKAAVPGPHWFSIEMSGERPVVFALTMLPERLTMLVFHRDVERRTRVFQYASGLQAGQFATPDQVRRLEIVERFYLSGRLEHAYGIAGESLAEDADNPLLLCLRGYLALKLNHLDAAAAAGWRLVELHGQLSDGHVILGEYGAMKEDFDGAVQAYFAALRRGLPVFSEGSTHLHDAVSSRGPFYKYFVNTPEMAREGALLEKVVAKRVSGLLWTAWTPDPEEFAPGSQLL